jgi:large subunit ribosomal protein L19
MDMVKKTEEQFRREKDLPEFQVGDVVNVHVKIREGEKERVQIFTGTVIKIKGRKGVRATFTVRRIVAGEGVERTFPYHSPMVQNVHVKRPGRVRRAKLYYLRERVGKATKVKERRVPAAGKAKGGKKRRAAEEQRQQKEVGEPVA